MTIMIERDYSPLRVIDTSPSSRHYNHHNANSSSQYETSLTEDDFLLVDFQPLGCPLVGKLRSSTVQDDDTASTGSLSSDSYDSQENRRVSFSVDLVTDVWTRPFTPRAEASDLFYSTEETSRYVMLVEFYVKTPRSQVLTLGKKIIFID